MSPHFKPAALFPSSEERLACEHRLTDELLKARQGVAAGSVTPTIDFAAFRHELSNFDFAVPRPLDEVLAWTNAQLKQGIVHVTHPRYFGLFNPSPTFPAQCADRIAGAFNPQLASSKTSPVAVEIESHVIRLLADRAGLPAEATGHFTSGGTEANFTALVCALTKADSRFAASGARVFEGAPTFYASRESHLAWIKIAHETGIGRQAVRLIGTDGWGRMNPAALRAAIEADRAKGCVPVMVAATAGTTGAGMIDPLRECAGIARENGLWCHVDAAWGGALIVSDRRRGTLAGLNLADSITIDAHKWLATTMGCGMFLTRHASVLTEAFDVSTSYMPSYIPMRDPYVTTAQWSRRFMGLRLFLSLAAAGWTGFAEHIERSIALAAYAKELLQNKGWRIVNDSPLAVLCILPARKDASPDAIVERVLASGQAWVSVASYEGEKVIRACVSNGETAREDVDALVRSLEEALASVTKTGGSYNEGLG
jgi:glutamate/tyrosine decarboxylase-like PLP-dependent enzyme